MENMLLILVAAVVFGVTGFVLARLNTRRDPESIAKMSTLEAQLEASREQARQKGLQAAELEHDLEVMREQLDDAQQRAATFEERARVMGESRQVLENAFKSLSADALKNNNQQFLALARETLVSPVRESLDKVDQKIHALEKARVEAYGEIRQQFTQMAEAHGQLRTETASLVRALRQPHVRGRWGEIQLRRVVEMAGMMAHCDFVEQQSAEAKTGKLRPTSS
jgi:DNA recombination protein RmuC